MFENSFIPYLKEVLRSMAPDQTIEDVCLGQDLMDQSVKSTLVKSVKHLQTASDVVDLHALLKDAIVLYDYDLTPERRPKILVQVAAHASGAAYYYTKRLLPSANTEPTDGDQLDYLQEVLKMQKSMGCCIHPIFGGWFALRAGIVLPSVHCPDLPRREPEDSLNGDVSRIAKLLYLFNNEWQNNKYRDILLDNGDDLAAATARGFQRYSHMQMDYFLTLPAQRAHLISKWLGEGRL